MPRDPDKLVWPDGTVFTITRSSAQTEGRELEMEWVFPAHAWAPQRHVHPRLTEEYEVLDGSLEILIGREWRQFTRRERASVPPGTVHTFRVGTDPARVRNVHRPPLDFEPYIRALCRTANEHDLGDLSDIRSLIYVAMLVEQYPKHSRAPGRLLNAAVRPLCRLGRGLGLRTA
jgi:hypothetical protein